MRRQHDRASRRARRTSAAPSEDAVVARLQALGAQLATAPSPDHRSATRARLVAMAAVRAVPLDAAGGVAAPGPASPQRRGRRTRGTAAPRWRTRATAGLAGAALSVSTVGGLLAASQGTGPGDLLYGVKRGGERTQLALASDATRGRTLLDLATTRLTELSELTRDGAVALPAAAAPAGDTTLLAAGAASGMVLDTLATMDDQTTQGTWWVATTSVAAGEADDLAALASWAADQESGLDALGAALPTAAAPAFAASADLVAAVADRATGLVEALGCDTGPATSGTDELGPRPAPCPPSDHDPGGGGEADTDGSSVADTASGPAGDPAGEPGATPDEVLPADDVPPADGAPGPAAPPPGNAASPRSPAGPPGAVPPVAGDGATRLPAPSPPPVPLPPAGPSGEPAPPAVPPVVDPPLPLCVSALGLPVLC